MSNMEGPLPPQDRWNTEWLSRVHPPGWKQPTPGGRYNLVVLGAGTAGLVTAAAAAGLGAKVALVERQWLGGDCLNVGCVPSKTLIAAARECWNRGDASLGAGLFREAMERVRRTRAEISHHDSAQRFTGLGVDVFLGGGRFVDSETVEVDGVRLKFAKAVIATGARAVAPEVEGLSEAGYLTNETVFNLTERPGCMAVVGAGPIGCELAQAFRRFGSEVHLLHRGSRILERELAEASEVVAGRFQREGVKIHVGAELSRVRKRAGGGGRELFWRVGDREVCQVVDSILIGVGRAPNVEGLGLEKVGVEYDVRAGVRVDDFMRTTHPRIFAAGDVCMAAKFTHAADFAARMVIQNALFKGRKRLSALNIPRCTYTDPELAHTGWDEESARRAGVEVVAWTRPFSEVDRAKAEGDTEGFVRILTEKGSGRIVGGTVVGAGAGDLISEISVAVASRMKLGALASVIHPYPTRAEAIRQLGDAFNRTRLTPRIKGWFERWLRWQRS